MIRTTEVTVFGTAIGRSGNETVGVGFLNQLFKHAILKCYEKQTFEHFYLLPVLSS